MTSNTEMAPSIEMQAAPKRPTPKEIDKLIAEYAVAQSDAARSQAVTSEFNVAAGEMKVRLTAMVETFGARYTEKSKRLAGHHNSATTTTGTLVTIIPAAVEKLRVYLGTTETPRLVEEFFVEQTAYSLVKGPDKVLQTLQVGARLRTKISGMLKNCFDIGTKKPSLTVELAELKSV